jgi:hypothetical protein
MVDEIDVLEGKLLDARIAVSLLAHEQQAILRGDQQAATAGVDSPDETEQVLIAVKGFEQSSDSLGIRDVGAPRLAEGLELLPDSLVVRLAAARLWRSSRQLRFAASRDRLNDLFGEHETDAGLSAEDVDCVDLLLDTRASEPLHFIRDHHLVPSPFCIRRTGPLYQVPCPLLPCIYLSV